MAAEDEDDEIEVGFTPKKLPAHLQVLIDLMPLNVPVHRSTIEAAYKKPEYARRIRKIVSEYGWAIERTRGAAGANDDWYVRRSDGPVRKAHVRKEVGPKLRPVIYARDGFRCRMCGADVSAEQSVTKPQCDHKVPAERGGPTVPANLQTLCLVCNLKKRQACMGCALPDCEGCPYAYPEKFEEALTLRLPKETAAKLSGVSDRDGVPPLVIIRRLIDGMP